MESEKPDLLAVIDSARVAIERCDKALREIANLESTGWESVAAQRFYEAQGIARAALDPHGEGWWKA